MHGQFVWYELTTPDIDAARKFYPAITGWGTQHFDNDYTMWTNGGVPFAGLFRLGPDLREQGVPPNWMPYIESNSVDETARLATSLGGKVMHGPEDIPNTGRFAVVQDPQGATFGVYKSLRPSQSWEGTPALGRFSWHELMTTDHTKAFEFYKKLFGWEKTGEMDMGGGQMYTMYGKGGKPYGGIFNRHGDMMSIPPFWLVYIFVKDVKKAVDAAVKGGAKVQRPPMEIPGGGTIAILGDPQGAAFALHADSSVTAAKPAAKKAAKPAAKKAAAKRPKAKKAAAKKRSAAKKRPAAKKRSAAKRRPAAKKRSAAKKRPAAKKRRR
jgi:predicted enzyme related to lactoylglutathione lyase